ncbi:MAG: TrbC/VirB2 family protein [Patescibacteria group bacterium]
MKYIKKNLFNFILTAFMLVLPVLSLADTTIENPIASKTIIDFIQKILEGVIKIGMPIIVLAIIYCGFLFVSAQGKPESIKKAKDALLYTLIGAAILLGSWAIAQLIKDTVLKL